MTPTARVTPTAAVARRREAVLARERAVRIVSAARYQVGGEEGPDADYAFALLSRVIQYLLGPVGA